MSANSDLSSSSRPTPPNSIFLLRFLLQHRSLLYISSRFVFPLQSNHCEPSESISAAILQALADCCSR
ncbi:hypothetical protein PAHAL_9G426800 [Panicum hallii]|uniref:Uncharacterized protein n=1 Tax=Panicum hallii TaxID=206008 RepID=A0A2S3IPL9_9POAL|nr:hypothetical protein PAHAL_9G426800 [Panicum hallii]